MGYQPSLDGVRAISVIAVILYHAGFEWMHGGFFGVEVFFVVSGFLITALLLDERERSGRVSLRSFWLRRARRLLPALVLVLVAVGVYASLAGSDLLRSDVRRDLPWALGYAANWGQIVGGAQYFGNLSPLRHLWSVAVEEQWYVVWPLVFVVAARLTKRARLRAALFALVAVGLMVLTWWMAREPQLAGDRVNLLYLSTFTRASGLLLGAAAAFVWRPWRSLRAGESRAGRLLDASGVVAVVVLGWSFAEAALTDRSVYRWHLALVTVASLVLVLVVVHPASAIVRRAFAWGPFVEIGKRSYGLYLWSWPVSVVIEAYTGSWSRFVVAMIVTVVVSEVSYRFVETPIRTGALGRWFARERSRDGHWYVGTTAGAITTISIVAPLLLFFGRVEHVDPAAGGDRVSFVMPATTAAAPTTPSAASAAVPAPAEVSPSTPSSTAGSAAGSTVGSVDASVAGPSVEPTIDPPLTTIAAPPSTPPVLPRRLVVVGDSMAHSLAINLPDGIESTFAIADSIEPRDSAETFSPCSSRALRVE